MKVRTMMTALALMASTAIFAQHEMKRAEISPEERAQKMTDKLAERLELNDEQKQAVLKLNTEQAKQMQAKREESKKEREARHVEMKEHRSAYEAELKEILTEDQYAKFQADVKKRHEKMSMRKEHRAKQRLHEDMKAD